MNHRKQQRGGKSIIRKKYFNDTHKYSPTNSGVPKMFLKSLPKSILWARPKSIILMRGWGTERFSSMMFSGYKNEAESIKRVRWSAEAESDWADCGCDSSKCFFFFLFCWRLIKTQWINVEYFNVVHNRQGRQKKNQTQNRTDRKHTCM